MKLRLFTLLLVVLVLPACSSDSTGTMMLYTSVTADTVDAVVAGFEEAHPDLDVQVFRAPTGELNARIAADRRAGGIEADVLWLTDPLSMQQYDAEGLLRGVFPDAAAVPAEYRQERFWGTRILNLVVVRHRGVAPVVAWDDLVSAAALGHVCIPDPAFAGSAFAALAYFAFDGGYGLEFLQQLRDAGTTIVASPGDVVTAVAEGQCVAGITLDTIAADAVADGSPIELVWPEPGAIAVYSPIAVTGTADGATDFVSFVLGVEGQTAIAGSGWQPVDPDIPWISGGPQVTVDWDRAFDHQQELLDAFRSIFGG